jgi:hypothetical protein
VPTFLHEGQYHFTSCSILTERLMRDQKICQVGQIMGIAKISGCLMQRFL